MSGLEAKILKTLEEVIKIDWTKPKVEGRGGKDAAGERGGKDSAKGTSANINGAKGKSRGRAANDADRSGKNDSQHADRARRRQTVGAAGGGTTKSRLWRGASSARELPASRRKEQGTSKGKVKGKGKVKRREEITKGGLSKGSRLGPQVRRDGIVRQREAKGKGRKGSDRKDSYYGGDGRDNWKSSQVSSRTKGADTAWKGFRSTKGKGKGKGETFNNNGWKNDRPPADNSARGGNWNSSGKGGKGSRAEGRVVARGGGRWGLVRSTIMKARGNAGRERTTGRGQRRSATGPLGRSTGWSQDQGGAGGAEREAPRYGRERPDGDRTDPVPQTNAREARGERADGPDGHRGRAVSGRKRDKGTYPEKMSVSDLSAEDRKHMKKMTVVAQHDKVPNPGPALMKGFASGQGRRKRGEGSLGSRVGANFNR